MNYIQTLYISPSQDPFKDSFGWISPIYHLLSWGLSAMSLKDSLGSLCLYTNKKGKDILVKFLMNEKETLIPELTAVQGPYYRWEDVKAMCEKPVNERFN